MNIYFFTFNKYSENTYILSDETNKCIIIDPGFYTTEEKKIFSSFIENKRLEVVSLYNTHCHIDHILGNYEVQSLYKAPLFINPIEEQILKMGKIYASPYGFPEYQEVMNYRFIKETDTIHFGNTELKVLFLPGHSPGHIGFYNDKDKVLVSGDVLFYKSIGRTDLPGGDLETLVKSIHKNIFTLEDSVKVYPGHGKITTVGYEKKNNPFVKIK